MGQVTIYLDDETEKQAREAAQANGMSLSRWVADKVQRGARSEWPVAVRKLAGKWTDLEPVEKLRERAGGDIARERL